MKGVMIAVVLASACISPVIPIGAGSSKSAAQRQHETLDSITPGRLVTGETWSGEITTKKIRVWADQQYRAQNVRWQHSFDEPLELVNAVLGGTLGLQLVADYVAWDRHEPSATLDDTIAELAARDPGGDVFCVVGLTSSLALAEASFESLGVANLGGRHLVVRGYADLAERKLYADAFRDLRDEERELALVQRRQHKTAVILLHELGHVLGLDHDDGEDSIMASHYSHRAHAFSADARARLVAALDGRLQRTAPAGVAAAPPAAPASQPIVIRVSSEGSYYFGNLELPLRGIEEQLRSRFASAPATEVMIQRDRAAPRAAIAELVDRAQAIGFTKVSLHASGL